MFNNSGFIMLSVSSASYRLISAQCLESVSPSWQQSEYRTGPGQVQPRTCPSYLPALNNCTPTFTASTNAVIFQSIKGLAHLFDQRPLDLIVSGTGHPEYALLTQAFLSPVANKINHHKENIY